MKTSIFVKRVALFLAFVLAVSPVFMSKDADAKAKLLRTESARADEVKGVFSVIFYGRRNIDDIETVAILDREGDKYTFEPYAPEFDYTIKNGVPDKEALAEAQRFVSFHSSFLYSILSKIIDPEGNIIGFEVRPMYLPLTFGFSNVLDIDYWLEDSKVSVKVKLLPQVEMMFRDGGQTKDDH